MVTMPTVRSPASIATRPTTGAAPVPVPPPIPAVMKTIRVSSPIIALRISSTLSSAASRATSGRLPAPSPRVRLGPSSTRCSTLLLEKACLSVLHTRKDTPRTAPWLCIMLTALPPPPPTPTTLISWGIVFSSYIKSMLPRSVIPRLAASGGSHHRRPPRRRPLGAPRGQGP